MTLGGRKRPPGLSTRSMENASGRRASIRIIVTSMATAMDGKNTARSIPLAFLRVVLAARLQVSMHPNRLRPTAAQAVN